MRLKSFASRRAWKCKVEGLEDLPQLQVSLDVPGCSAEFQALITERKEQCRRLRKRVRQEAQQPAAAAAAAAAAPSPKSSSSSRSLAPSGRGEGAARAREPARALARRPAKKPLTTDDAKRLHYCRLPPPVPAPQPPPDAGVKCSFEPHNVVRVDVSEGINDAAREYILRLADMPDVTLIVKGLTAKLTPTLWTWEYLLARCGHVVWKKVRVFEKKDPASDHWHERGWKTMSLLDYHEYLQRRQAGDPAALSMVYYWIDFPIKEYLPELYTDYARASPIDLFPGGSNCAQQYVTESARPDMGPNLYITPPGGRTWFHEDGHGTVDSGHQCMTGRNEVIMLRRLTDEPSRLNALHCLNTGEALDNTRPHDDATLTTATRPWPTEETLRHLRDDLHAGPASVVLEPGEFIHINKGRLHAFRKKIPAGPETVQDLCISVAWDWMYQGHVPTGAQGEADVGSLHTAQNQLFQRQSLGIYGSTLVHGAFAQLGKLRAMEAIEKQQARSLLDPSSKAHASKVAPGSTSGAIAQAQVPPPLPPRAA